MNLRLSTPWSLLGFHPALFAAVRSSVGSRFARGEKTARVATGVCPGHGYPDVRPTDDDRKTGDGTTSMPPGIVIATNGDVTITSHALAKQVLKSRSTEQAGFNADLVKLFPQKNTSVLFLEGETHRQRRSVVAHFFAPAAIRDRYRPVMEAVSDHLIDKLVQAGSAVLDDMTLELTVGVTAEIVGMTGSSRLGLARRLVRFFEGEACVKSSGRLAIVRYIVAMQINLLRVYLNDVRPAILARRREPRDDLVSHLVAKTWSHLDILKECVTYGTAGMSTTREFIVVAAWHLLTNETLRKQFKDGNEADRTVILGEVLRLEPPVSTLFRKTVETVVVRDERGQTKIPPGSHIAIDIAASNTDATAVGTCPFKLDATRVVAGPDGLLSFGDGHHRCPGAAIAMEEAIVFLERLLRVPNIRLDNAPAVSRNKMSTGYVLRNVVVTTS